MNFTDYLKKNHNITLNIQQERAMNIINGATLLLAVPGSGKTTVIVTRIGNMIYNYGISPEKILTLTFSVAAASDMKARFVNIFGQKYKNLLKFKTIHSFCYTVIKDYERLLKTTAFEIIQSNNFIIKQILLSINNKYMGEEVIRDISQKIGYCKNMMLTKEEIKEIEVPDYDFYDIYLEYENYKKQNRLMDYDDMLNYTYTILKRYPEILSKYHNTFEYINVDEAQDTSFVQHKIIELLASKSGNIFMVGDEDQSIYGFRAAYPKALLNFKDTYKDAQVILMEQNYRSTDTIVKAASRFIKQNKIRYDKNMFCKNEKGCILKKTLLDDIKEQYDYIADEVKGNNGSMAILYRNNDSAIPLIDNFERENIPYYAREQKSMFFSHFVVNDIISFIKLILDNGNVLEFEKIYYKMDCMITKQMLSYVKQNNRGNVFSTLLKLTNLSEYNRKKIEDIKQAFDFMKKLKPFRVIEYIENKIGYYENLKDLSRKGYNLSTLEQKIHILKIIASKTSTLDEFLNRISELEIIVQTPTEKNQKVTLSTIHSSKGLEFDKVILIDAVEGQFPSKESMNIMKNKGDRTYFEEEVRLFYVGITRAKSELEIITSSRINGEIMIQSRFISYLLYEKEGNQKKSISQQIVNSYSQNTNIEHIRFGKGTILEYENGIITVKFKVYGVKRIALLTCLENNLISIVK